MKRLIATLVVAAVAVAPGVASAKPKAKVYRGTFSFVGADGDYVTGKFGKARLVDARRDSLSVHVRRLAPRTTYVFRLQSGQRCEEHAAGGTNVRGWRYRRGGVLKTNRKGVANGAAKARRFKVARNEDYGVVVTEKRSGRVVLCASLQRTRKGKGKAHDKPSKRHDRPSKRHEKPSKPDGKRDTPKPPEHRGYGRGEERGKRDAAPGHNKAQGEKRATGRGQGNDRSKARGNKGHR